MNKVTTTKATKTVSKTAKTTKPRTTKKEEVVPEVVQEVVPPSVSLETKVEETDSVKIAIGVPVVEVTMKERFDELIKSRQELMNNLKKEIQELRKMQRDYEHAIKDAAKRSKKKKAPRDENNPRKPSGFASPVIVSDELYKFLEQYGVKKTDPVARTDVTRYITTYIKEKDLQNPEHRREIMPDATLKKLFGPAMEPKDPNDANSPLVYTYLKLQRYLSPHFPKKAAPVVAV
jgi:chromatin remodeling complex protein RSC6